MHFSITLLYFLLAIILVMIHQASSLKLQRSICSETTMFANNSAYETNLNTLLRSLSINATNNPSGYYRKTVDNPTSEPIYAHYLCRGDQDAASCLECVTNSTTELPKTYCPNQKSAIVWYDECMVRYSNVPFFNKMEKSPSYSWYNRKNPIKGNATRFMEIVDNMFNNVIVIQAAEGGPVKKFAVDYVDVSYIQAKTMYGLGECTPDLTRSDCNECLSSTVQSFSQSLAARYFFPSCRVRYAYYPVFNLSYLSLHPLPPPGPLPSPPGPLTSPPGPLTSPPPSPSPSPSPSPANSTSTITKPIGKPRVSAIVVVSIIASLLVVFSVIVISVCIYLLTKKATKGNMINDSEVDNQDFIVESLQYDLATLISATNNFSIENKLGEGGFGGVYKGTLSNGQLIAVKRLSASSNQGLQEFKSEVLLVAKLQHRNLVRLLGFCYTRQEKLLVYEHVANKSLDKFLFDHDNRQQLDWQRRYKIIRGIARGMLYLHHDSQFRIIHRDLKASNILLDEEMNPKISDFGTSRLFGVDQNQSNYTSKVVGTYGYMAPEYALHGHFSIKSDAYSFGVLVLEIISGRRNSSFNQPDGSADLLRNAWEQWAAGTPLECVDPTIRESCLNNSEAIRCIHLGLLCIQDSVEDRPTMANVVLTLDSFSVTIPIPRQPSFFARSRYESALSEEAGRNHSSTKLASLSVNDVSITEPEPR